MPICLMGQSTRGDLELHHWEKRHIETLAVTAATGAIGLRSAAAEAVEMPRGEAPARAKRFFNASSWVADGGTLLSTGRRRDFKTVPMILSHKEQWDHEALSELS
jgi:hypothetical protein